MRPKRRIELLGILLLFFFTAYVAFITSKSTEAKGISSDISSPKKAEQNDSTSMKAAKKLYRKASIKHIEVQKMIIEKAKKE